MDIRQTRMAGSLLHPYVVHSLFPILQCYYKIANCLEDGGFLQFGTPNTFSAAGLLGEGALNAVIVMPAYRLGVFGFLYSSELENDASTVGEAAGNQGFWDQRLALEWTKDNISLFGGNPSQITVAGYSAGKVSPAIPFDCVS